MLDRRLTQLCKRRYGWAPTKNLVWSGRVLLLWRGMSPRVVTTSTPTLGLPTRMAPETSVPSSWIRALSRGGLVVPSERWMSVVEAFNVLFCIVIGRGADQKPGITRRLTELLLEKEPGLDQRIARKLVSTRLHIRLRALNQAKAEAAEKRRGEKQIRQHACSARWAPIPPTLFTASCCRADRCCPLFATAVGTHRPISVDQWVIRSCVKGIIFFPKCWSYSVEGVDEGGSPQKPKFFPQNCLTCKRINPSKFIRLPAGTSASRLQVLLQISLYPHWLNIGWRL